MSTAKLSLEGKDYEFPIIKGTEDEVGIDFTTLRSTTGAISYDPGFGNTGSCQSDITFIDGEKGILRYRGYAIEDLASNCSFEAVAYLLIFGKLPNESELAQWQNDLAENQLIHESMNIILTQFGHDAHPMAVLSSMIAAMSTFYRDSEEDRYRNYCRLLGQTSTIAAFHQRKTMGQKIIYPRRNLSFSGNFLRMMFSSPLDGYENFEVDPAIERAMNLLLILHADHEQNCSTSSVRMVGSSLANIFASMSSGINALWGPRHGGANQAVIEMLDRIIADGGDYKKYVEMAKDKDSGFKLMGFGHRVYKNFDPRARVIKKVADEVLGKLGIDDPHLEVAKRLEEVALSDPFFAERKLYPNVDFYSGIIYRAIGIPTDMFTVIFAIGRMPGWIAHWKELREDSSARINRPRQIYIGETLRSFDGLKEM